MLSHLCRDSQMNDRYSELGLGQYLSIDFVGRSK